MLSFKSVDLSLHHFDAQKLSLLLGGFNYIAAAHLVECIQAQFVGHDRHPVWLFEATPRRFIKSGPGVRGTFIDAVISVTQRKKGPLRKSKGTTEV